MIEDTIEHKAEMLFQRHNVVPGPQVTVDHPEINDGKATIRGVGKEWKDMQGVDWNARWLGPLILIALGLLVLAPKRSAVLSEPTVSGPEMDSDLQAASHDELPDPLIDDL